MKQLFLLLSLLLSSNQLLLSAEQDPEQEQSSDSRENTTCPICGKVYSKKTNLNRHMQTHITANLPKTDDKFKGLQCQYCSEYFTTLPSKYTHIQRWHPEEKLPNHKYRCSCKREFRLKDELIGHKARSKDDRCKYSLDEEQVPAISTDGHPILTPEQILAIEEQKKQQAAALQQKREQEELEKMIEDLMSLSQAAGYPY